jgi:hypothetical protein
MMMMMMMMTRYDDGMNDEMRLNGEMMRCA